MPRRKVSKEVMEEKKRLVLKLHDQGLTPAQIELQVRMHKTTIGRIIKNRGK